jgi:uncharacterized protein (DUF362 family)
MYVIHGAIMIRSKVAVFRTQPGSVIEDIFRLLEAAEVDKALDLSKTTVLKDNISWHMPFLSANTTPWQLEGTIKGLHKIGMPHLAVVHNNTVVTNAEKGGRLNRLAPVYRKYAVPEFYNFRKEDIGWKLFEPKARMRVLHKIFPQGIRIPDYFVDKNIVHLPTVKCHIYTTTTGAMKNAFGGLLNKKRHITHSYIHETLVDLLAIQKEIHSGIFTVMDGTLCGNGPGPRTLIPVPKNLILASADSVAIDAVAAKMMGFNPMDIGYIRLAHEDGLGIGRIDEIDVVGEDISNMNFGFRVGNNMASLVGNLLWFGPMKPIQKVFLRTPLVYLFVLGSFFYHDYIWWNTEGKRRMREAYKTDWGKLFLQYPIG